MSPLLCSLKHVFFFGGGGGDRVFLKFWAVTTTVFRKVVLEVFSEM